MLIGVPAKLYASDLKTRLTKVCNMIHTDLQFKGRATISSANTTIIQSAHQATLMLTQSMLPQNLGLLYV